MTSESNLLSSLYLNLPEIGTCLNMKVHASPPLYSTPATNCNVFSNVHLNPKPISNSRIISKYHELFPENPDKVWEEFENNGKTLEYVEDLEITGRPFNYDKKKREKALAKQLPSFCVFCKNNERPAKEYENHRTRDRFGKCTCPVLRAYFCPICKKVGGDDGHTKRYCPENKRSSWAGRLLELKQCRPT